MTTSTEQPAKRAAHRPPELDGGKGGKRRNLFLDERSMEIAREIGSGNASEGIRIALERYRAE